MQDTIAIAVAVAAGIWLIRTLAGQLLAPGCGPPPAGPAGSDGFVPLEALSRPKKKN
jgi:hypothetical protein